MSAQMPTGDPMETCRDCGKLYYTASGHNCPSRPQHPIGYAQSRELVSLTGLENKVDKMLDILAEILTLIKETFK